MDPPTGRQTTPTPSTLMSSTTRCTDAAVFCLWQSLRSTASRVAGASEAGLDATKMIPEQHRLLMSRDKMNLASVR